MKVKILFGIVVMLALAACEKNSNESSEKTASYYPLSTGSYWVYTTYLVDSLGNEEISSENDTVEIIGDSLINGKTYKKILRKQYKWSKEKEISLQRDSLGYIVNESGNILYSNTNFTDTLYSRIEGSTEQPYISWSYKMEPYNTTVNIPLGEFNDLINRKQTIVYLAELNNPKRYTNSILAKNIGKIKSQYSFSNLLLNEKQYYEERLVKFYIAE